MSRDDVSWDWLGEPLAIDFANTVLRRGSTYEELLVSAGDVVTWARHEDGRVPRLDRAPAARRLGEIRAVRDDVFALLHATAHGNRLPAAAAGRINARVRAHPVLRVLGAAPGTATTEVAGDPDAVAALLAIVAHATVQLIADSGNAVTLCDAPSCGQFFTRTRRNQRWCGPACGNRARVARHARG